MAKNTYSKEERAAQFLKTGVALAKKDGVQKVTVAAVAAKHEVTAPLVFHIFGSRAKLHAAIKKEAKRQGVELGAAPKPKVRKVARSAKSGKFVDKATVAASPDTTVTSKFKTQPAPSTAS